MKNAIRILIVHLLKCRNRNECGCNFNKWLYIGGLMKKQLIAVGILSICLFASACGSNTTDIEQETETVAVLETAETQEIELSELEQQIEEFMNATPSEITVTQDVLRGQWTQGSVLNFLEEDEEVGETFRLGNVRIESDGSSKNSYLIFSNNKFIVSYEVTEARLVGDKTNTMQGILAVSGLYRVIAEEEAEDEYFFDSEIEILLTEISMQSEVEIAEIMDELDSVIGTTLQKDVSFAVLGSNVVDELTEEQLAEYDIELPELIESGPLSGEWGFREDGSYGLILHEASSTQYYPMTEVWIGKENNNQLFMNAVHTKTKYTVDIDGEEVEPGLSLYHALTREEEIVAK